MFKNSETGSHKQIIHFCHSYNFYRVFVKPMVLHLRDSGFHVAASSKVPHEYQRRAIQEGIQYTHLDNNLTANPILLLWNFIGTLALLLRVRPGCIHVHMTTGALLPLMSGFLLRVPRRIYHNHGFSYFGHKGLTRLSLLVIEKLNCYLATDVLTVSESNRTKFIQDSVSSKKPLVFAKGSAIGLTPLPISTLKPRSVSKTSCLDRNLKPKVNLKDPRAMSNLSVHGATSDVTMDPNTTSNSFVNIASPALQREILSSDSTNNAAVKSKTPSHPAACPTAASNIDLETDFIEGFAFGYVGRPYFRKGFCDTLAAWQKSELADQGCKLLIAGCTEADAYRFGFTHLKSVKFYGYIEDIAEFYSQISVLLLPSYHEGFGQAIIEAAYFGVPAIASDIPGIHCAVVNEKTGLLHPPGDIDCIIDHMRELRENSELRAKLGEAARQRAIERFPRDQILKELEQFYKAA